jgi:hypothetical protein
MAADWGAVSGCSMPEREGCNVVVVMPSRFIGILKMPKRQI